MGKLGAAGGPWVEYRMLSLSVGIIADRFHDNAFTMVSQELEAAGEHFNAWLGLAHNIEAVLSNPATPVCDQQ
jgi:hypothetical protein